MSEAAHIQQARNELANAVGHGNEDAEQAAVKRLDAAGVDGTAAANEARKAAAQARAAAAGDDQSARSTPPKDRSAKAPTATTTAPESTK